MSRLLLRLHRFLQVLLLDSDTVKLIVGDVRSSACVMGSVEVVVYWKSNCSAKSAPLELTGLNLHPIQKIPPPPPPPPPRPAFLKVQEIPIVSLHATSFQQFAFLSPFDNLHLHSLQIVQTARFFCNTHKIKKK